MPQKLSVWTRAFALLAAILAASAFAAGAMAAPASASGSVDVIDARDFLNERGEIAVPFGKTLQLTISGTPLARAFARQPIEVRIYRLDNDGRGPYSLSGFDPSCTVYYGAVYRLLPGGDVITVATFNDIHWLNIDTAGRLRPGRFLLVFQTQSDDHDLFRLSLNKGLSPRRYFGLGLRLVVGTSYFPPNDVAAYVAKYRWTAAGQAADAKAYAPGLTCYRARQKASGPGGSITYLQACRDVAPSAG